VKGKGMIESMQIPLRKPQGKDNFKLLDLIISKNGDKGVGKKQPEVCACFNGKGNAMLVWKTFCKEKINIVSRICI
jgi:hypothetical protein